VRGRDGFVAMPDAIRLFDILQAEKEEQEGLRGAYESSGIQLKDSARFESHD
jgi:hypothetical protein